MIVLAYLAVAVLIVAGLAALARPRKISDEEYEEQKGKGGGPGNALSRGVGDALLGFEGFLEPSRRHIKQAKEERRAEREGEGDPPEPGD